MLETPGLVEAKVNIVYEDDDIKAFPLVEGIIEAFLMKMWS
jgi:hypothetical protein